MRRLLPALFGLALLSACETAGPPVGPTDALIEAGRYHVTFRGVSGASGPEVEDRALLHAANLALGQGYEWFRVARRAGGYAGPTSPQFSFGVGGASFGSHSSVGMGVGTGFDLGGGSYGATAATIEVFMGKGPKPPSLDAYDARSVSSSMSHPA